MRVISSMIVGVLALSGLAACGQSEQSLRASTRDQMLLGCRSGDAASRAQLTQAGVNVDQFCGCAIDKFMQSASTEQLRQISSNPNNVPGLETASAQCMREMMPQSTPTPGAPAAPNEAAAGPAAPAEAGAAEGNEAAEENGAAEE